MQVLFRKSLQDGVTVFCPDAPHLPGYIKQLVLDKDGKFRYRDRDQFYFYNVTKPMSEDEEDVLFKRLCKRYPSQKFILRRKINWLRDASFDYEYNMRKSKRKMLVYEEGVFSDGRTGAVESARNSVHGRRLSEIRRILGCGGETEAETDVGDRKRNES